MMFVNGTLAQTLPADDRGLAYGDGVFRTLRAVDGQPRHWALHYAKLSADCARLSLQCPPETVLLDEICRATAAWPDAAVKIIVTRGSGPRGYAPPVPSMPLRVVSASSLSAAAPVVEPGIHAHLCQLRLSHQPALAGAKHLNRLENVLARAEWHDAAIREGLLLDQDGNAIGGTMSNVFVVAHGQLFTPDLSRCGVAGVTRDRVMAWATAAGVRCQVTPISLQRLLDADEVFFTNSLIGLWSVATLQERRWPAGTLSKRIRAALENDGDDVAAD